MTLTNILEALLFSAQKPLSLAEVTAAIRAAEGDEESAPNEYAKVREPEVAAALELAESSGRTALGKIILVP